MNLKMNFKKSKNKCINSRKKNPGNESAPSGSMPKSVCCVCKHIFFSGSFVGLNVVVFVFIRWLSLAFSTLSRFEIQFFFVKISAFKWYLKEYGKKNETTWTLNTNGIRLFWFGFGRLIWLVYYLSHFQWQ